MLSILIPHDYNLSNIPINFKTDHYNCKANIYKKVCVNLQRRLWFKLM